MRPHARLPPRSIVVSIFKNLHLGGLQPPFREEYSQIFVLKVSQSALLPRIANLAFQPSLLLAGFLQSKMAPMLESMAARNGSPTLYRAPCQPIRMCTSWSIRCLSARPVDQPLAHGNSGTLRTVSAGTRGIRRELREQIFFPRRAWTILPASR
jgi:hypothetical protein